MWHLLLRLVLLLLEGEATSASWTARRHSEMHDSDLGGVVGTFTSSLNSLSRIRTCTHGCSAFPALVAAFTTLPSPSSTRVTRKPAPSFPMFLLGTLSSS